MDDSREVQRLTVTSVLLFILAYVVVFFPFAYFRHDDWLMLGNAILRLPKDWAFLFKTSWFDGGVEVTWFFRPFFKLAYYLGYQAFGFTYYAWLTSTLLLTLGAMYFAFKTVRLLTRSTSAASFCIIFFAGCLHFHLGSLLWAGEGFMNVPCVLLLSASAYCFTKYIQNKEVFLWQLLSILLFVAALGFKEASFSHVLFLSGIYFLERGKFEWWPKPLIPLYVLTGIYLVIRLFYLPINPFYHPKFGDGLHTLGYFLLAFLIPYVVLRFCFGKKWTRLGDVRYLPAVFFLLYLLVTSLPHQGHPFFSPGWLLSPGFFFSMALALTIRDPEKFKLKVGGWLLLFVASSGAVIWKMQSVEWWQWGIAQREMHQILASISPAKPEVVRVRNCSAPYVTPDRIIGYRGAVSDWYEAIHGTKLNFAYVPCKTPLWYDRTVLWYDYRFPHITPSIDDIPEPIQK